MVKRVILNPNQYTNAKEVLQAGDRVELIGEDHIAALYGQFRGLEGTVIGFSQDSPGNEKGYENNVRVAWDNESNDPGYCHTYLRLTKPKIVDDTRKYLEAITT